MRRRERNGRRCGSSSTDTPAGGGDAQDWVGAWLDGFDQALDLCRALETALDADTGKELSGDAR